MNKVCLSAFIWKDLVLSGLPKARMSLHNVAAGILRLRSCDIVTNELKADNTGKSEFFNRMEHRSADYPNNQQAHVDTREYRG